MDYRYGYPAPPPPPPPPPRHYHITRCHHYADNYFPYSRDFVERKAKIGLLAGISASSLGAGLLVGGVLSPVLGIVGAAGLATASVLAIKTAIQRRVAYPSEVVYDETIGYHR